MNFRDKETGRRIELIFPPKNEIHFSDWGYKGSNRFKLPLLDNSLELNLLPLPKLDLILLAPNGPALMALGGASGIDVTLPQIEAVLAAEKAIAAKRRGQTTRDIVEEAMLAQATDLNNPFDRAVTAVWFEARGNHFHNVARSASPYSSLLGFERRLSLIHSLPFLKTELFMQGKLMKVAIACHQAAEFLAPLKSEPKKE